MYVIHYTYTYVEAASFEANCIAFCVGVGAMGVGGGGR